MQKFSAMILSDEFSTTEVLKLFVGEFDNIDLLEASSSYSEIVEVLANCPNKTVFIVHIELNVPSIWN